MRIEGWHVDGYGVLKDFSTTGLPPGLTVVIGPNEAGKSTLLDFIRAMLFGFPTRKTVLRHEPVHGGRHGGRLTLIDSKEKHFELERYSDIGAKGGQANLFDGTGERLPGHVLSDLLGNVDSALFASVFAFGLGELASFASLDSDAVRDRIFSAGVLGAGMSARRAIDTLKAGQESLIRPRKRDAVANSLQAQIDELSVELKNARFRSFAYFKLDARCHELGSQIQDAKAVREGLVSRQADLRRLIDNSQTLQQRHRAEAELEILGNLTEVESAAVAQKSAIDLVFGELSGQIERLDSLESAEAELSETFAQISTRSKALGISITATALRPNTWEITQAEQVAEHYSQLTARVVTLKADEIRCREALDQAKRASEGLENEYTQWLNANRAQIAIGDGEPSTETSFRHYTTISGLRKDLEELRGLLLLSDQLEAATASAAREKELIAVTRAATELSPITSRIGWLMIALAVILAGAGGYLVKVDHNKGAGIIVVCAICILIGSIVLLRNLPSGHSGQVFKHDQKGSAGETSAEVAKPKDPIAIDGSEVRLSSCRDEISRLASRLQLHVPVLGPPLSALGAKLEEEFDLARRHSSSLSARESADAAYTNATLALDPSLSELRAIDDDIASKALVKGLAGVHSPSSYSAALSELDALAERETKAGNLRSRTKQMDSAAKDYEAQLASLKTQIGDDDTIVQRDDHDATFFRRRQFANSIRTIKDRADLAVAKAEKAKALRDEIATTIAMLSAAFGKGRVAEDLLVELEQGEIASWNTELESIGNQLRMREVEIDELFAEHAKARNDRDLLLGSNEIAKLEMSIEALQTELDVTVRRYAVLGLARSLIELTLDRYEREHQPEVIAHAGMLFSMVTDKRYERLVVRSEATGKNARIYVVTPDGAQLSAESLSRGTAEQLYLCLRLGYAASFADKHVSLPLILDDVLVNFDPKRARGMAKAIAETSSKQQVLAFTCHPHIGQMLADANPSCAEISLAT